VLKAILELAKLAASG